MATYIYNTAGINKETGQDQVVNNERVRATYTGVSAFSIAPNEFGTMYMAGTGAPTSLSGASGGTLTAAQLGTGIVTINSTASAQTWQLPSPASIIQYMEANSAGVLVGDYLQCLIVNGGATNAFTIGITNGVTFDANQLNTSIPASTSKFFNFRVTNITVGSEAVVAYF